jgi:transcriptional regulator with XRE-family HTH domain
MWLWASRHASAALQSRDLGLILRVYRQINRLSQERLAAVLGYDKTYISMIETHRRSISDIGTLRHIAHTLGIPVHVLGVTEPDDATYLAMVQFAESILKLAEIARQSGRAVDAINELWPFVARLEARAADGLTDRDSLDLLGRARLALGVALGTVLPEETLASAARWTGQALIVVERLENATQLGPTLAMHGNELRKAGRLNASIMRLRRAATTSQSPDQRTVAYAMLARAAGEAGQPELFDDAVDAYRRQLEGTNGSGMFPNQFTFNEIRLRGLVGTGRAQQAAGLLSEQFVAPPVAPQWAVIANVTTAEVLLHTGDHQGAEHYLVAAIAEAETYRLPHQIQRCLRLAHGRFRTAADAGRAALTRLSRRLIESS